MKIFNYPLVVTFLAFTIMPIQSCKKVEKIQNDVLEYSLNALGSRLFNLIEDGPGKDDLKAKYNSFVDRATRGEADQDQIEYVAANILNASNSRDSISNELAGDIVKATEPDYNHPAFAKTEPSKNALSDVERMSIGENLSGLLKWNENLFSRYKNNQKKASDQVFYEYDNGIVVNLDEELRSQFDEAENIDLAVELKDLEKYYKTEWKQDLAVHLEEAHKQFRQEMKKLEKLKGMEFNEEFDFNFLSFADSTFHMPNMEVMIFKSEFNPVDVDSILKAVEKSLEAAGIPNH